MRSLSLRPARRYGFVTPFEDLFGELDRAFSPSFSSKTPFGDFSPAMDIEEKDETYYATVDLPGLKKEDIKIDLQDSVLTISGERVSTAKGEGRHTERVHGQFLRSFTLPHQVDAEKIEAKFEDGVLHVTLPKSETAKARSIKIQ